MSDYKQIYLDAFGYSKTDFIASELSGAKAVDIHHITAKGMGGNPKGDKNRIENLQALTREEHLFYGDKIEYKAFLYQKHKDFLEFNGVVYSESYLNALIDKYLPYAANNKN